MKRNPAPSLLVISSFPERGQTHGKQTVGVAPYARNMFLGILAHANKQNKPLAVTILAEQLAGQPSVSTDHGMTVRRVWKLNSPLSLVNLAYQAIRNRSKTALIHFEFAMFGRLFTLPFPLILLLILKLAGKRTVLAMHQVPHSIHDIAQHMNIPAYSWQSDIATIGLHVYYRLLLSLTDRFIVFDEVFKERLAVFGSAKKIGVIPHGVENPLHISRSGARRALSLSNEFVILCFGYLAWYKGTDWIMEYIASLKKHAFPRPVRLIIAGGPNPQRMDLPYYQQYVGSLQTIARKSSGTVVITGYVPERAMSRYFAACDIALLPYRTFMSASGPMAIAARFGTPIVLSEALERVLDAPDAQGAMARAGIKNQDIVMPFDAKKYTTMLHNYMTKPELVSKMSVFTKQLAKTRAFTRIAKYWWQEIM